MVLVPAKHHHHPARIISRLDLRVRVVATVLLAVCFSMIGSLPILALFLLPGVCAVPFSRLGIRSIFRRLAPFNLFVFFAFCFVPWGAGGTTLFQFAGFSYQLAGFLVVLRTAVVGNAILLVMLTLLANTEMTLLGQAFRRLGMPQKMVQLLLFTIRYLSVFESEWVRMSLAAKARGFRPKMNRHTYKTYAQMIALLFVRSLERSERVLAAMKCRGFHGRFYPLDDQKITAYDILFLVLIAAVMTTVLVYLDHS
ncbi:MAG: energy-coupling factor transporter transmembrane protein EcfT [Planctomycetaceae bacterium]|nr:energy-coupling factor transporter transmembrane protein EcfT [Planctomycetaceae bacterium]